MTTNHQESLSSSETSKFDSKKYTWDEIQDEEIKTVTLPSGKKSEYIAIDGIIYPIRWVELGFSPDLRVNLPRIKQMKARDDDVLICAYPKAGILLAFTTRGAVIYSGLRIPEPLEFTWKNLFANPTFWRGTIRDALTYGLGTHWLWEITKMLSKKKAEYEIGRKDTAMLEFHEPKEFEDMASPRIFNTHLFFRHIPTEMLEKKCKIIFIQRNPKDVAVSFYNHTKVLDDSSITWEDYLFTFGTEFSEFSNWYDYTLDFERALYGNNDVTVHLLYYEDLKRNPVKEIRRLAEHLEVKCDDQLIKDISDKCDFHNLKEANIKKEGDRSNIENGKHKSDGLYRKGEVGDWENWFTVAQNERFDADYKEKMKNSKLKFIYELISQ